MKVSESKEKLEKYKRDMGQEAEDTARQVRSRQEAMEKDWTQKMRTAEKVMETVQWSWLTF